MGERKRGFEIAKGWEDKDIHLPVRKTKHAAAYDIEAAEDVVIPAYKPGIKPTLIPTGLKAYCNMANASYLFCTLYCPSISSACTASSTEEQ